MYRNLDDGSSMLVTSYAGETLKDFQQLSVKDRPTLLLRVVRLHRAGVLHNDLERRNIVLSKRLGPRIIDFDNATFDHACRGLSCKELSELSRRLGLDLGGGGGGGGATATATGEVVLDFDFPDRVDEAIVALKLRMVTDAEFAKWILDESEVLVEGVYTI
ncbi:hypothetical protein B0H16DRAFT_1479986 [Mycena metata]|uniref:Protein kinase domain-containing protein n=1 Tax=Mycena metata TaxID=1033252 RepID=A0AAD7MDW3_9AGAR|nr:hypothetical protein B0H16DRAFT_1479986 [Mycena metata]